MKQITLIILCAIILLTCSDCNNEPDPLIGNVKLTVTYPEAAVENGSVYFIQVPGAGAEARLYDKDARCLGYKDAGFGIAYIGENSVHSQYVLLANEKGEILFKDIQSGEYYLTIYAREISKYTQKYIEVTIGDTLKLIKDFTSSLTFFEDLEPWDYEMPTN